MYISRIRVQGYRCCNDTSVKFNRGLNVIIGENNAGKSTILKALGLVFSRSGQKLTVDDFYRWVTPSDTPPSVTITVIICGTADDRPEDKAVVASWLTKLASPWEATLTFRYFLPETELETFQKELNGSGSNYWEIVEKNLPKFVSRIYGGNPDAKNRAESEWLEKFDYHFLDAIRDAETYMFSGKNALLKKVLQRFLDYDLNDKTAEEKQAEILRRRGSCDTCSTMLLGEISQRIDRNAILDLASKTGASIGGKPEIAGRLDETDLLSALKLVIHKQGLDLPLSHNGLGYNNLIYISLILANLDVETSSFLGENAKVFPMLLIEEPEAHLHPPMQYKFLKFLSERVNAAGKSRQIFITTHSTHITAAVGLDTIVCMSTDDNGRDVRVSYPGKVFSSSATGQTSKNYVERYLDATKSNMLFSKGIIFVEGMAELLLFPVLSEIAGCSLEDRLVTIIRVDGVTFKHFLPIFGVGVHEDLAEYALKRKVACVVDTDPSRRRKIAKARWKKCWPYELEADADNFEYRPRSGVAENLFAACLTHTSVQAFSGVPGKEKTFEYDLAYANPGNKLLLTSMSDEATANLFADLSVSLDDMLATLDDERIIASVPTISGDDAEKKRALLASSYLLDVEASKGSHSLELSRNLKDAINAGNADVVVIPKHIRDAIRWACGMVDTHGR